MTETTPAPTYSLRYKAVIALVLVVALGAFAAAYMNTDTTTKDPVTVANGGEFVEKLIPGRGDEVQRQSDIGIDLAPGWDGTLSINGTDVSGDDHFERDAALNILTYHAREGSTVQLKADTNCVVARVWRSAVGQGKDDQFVSWCFQAT
jgi:hypothetical protein